MEVISETGQPTGHTHLQSLNCQPQQEFYGSNHERLHQFRREYVNEGQKKKSEQPMTRPQTRCLATWRNSYGGKTIVGPAKNPSNPCCCTLPSGTRQNNLTLQSIAPCFIEFKLPIAFPILATLLLGAGGPTAGINRQALP